MYIRDRSEVWQFGSLTVVLRSRGYEVGCGQSRSGSKGLTVGQRGTRLGSRRRGYQRGFPDYGTGLEFSLLGNVYYPVHGRKSPRRLALLYGLRSFSTIGLPSFLRVSGASRATSFKSRLPSPVSVVERVDHWGSQQT
ncbi:hypothetical protein PIIN_01836 [Serendipita indica DSM 11827]|uniref:Uncharacterized protein n=1 Tax=Serendipita indica (strain DSM 11827) TaxID=1109443 RepID=G4T9J7_SERID|nr:hypothetical protein PIIN_01836 [Serendipita indica DSM 11827]